MRTSDRTTMRIDLKGLEKEARRSQDGEAYVQLFRSKDCRIGATAVVKRGRETSFSLEILINAMNMDSLELLSGLSNLLETVRALKEKDYALEHQDDGWIIAWKELRPDAMDKELIDIGKMMSSINKKNRLSTTEDRRE